MESTNDTTGERAGIRGRQRRFAMGARMREHGGTWHGGRGGWERRGRGGRMRRGQIRGVLLVLLAEEPGHGYELMQRLEEQSGGAWRPSPGSIYPTLQQLEDEGLVRSTERDGKRVYELTEAGRTEATRRAEESAGDPWASVRSASQFADLGEGLGELSLAVKQLMRAGNEEQLDQATEIVRDARKRLYRLLAEG